MGDRRGEASQVGQLQERHEDERQDLRYRRRGQENASQAWR